MAVYDEFADRVIEDNNSTKLEIFNAEVCQIACQIFELE